MPRRLLTEVLGTFALTFVAAGAPVIAAASHTAPNLVALVVAPALLVMAILLRGGTSRYAMEAAMGEVASPMATLRGEAEPAQRDSA
jgi:glycerol uptake facilitator-like aquaporin